jgi:hypothetical protein
MKLKLYFILHRNAKRTGAKHKKKRRQKLLLKEYLPPPSTKGDITVQFDTKAPSSYFGREKYVTDENQKETFYDGLKFHRVNNFMIQTETLKELVLVVLDMHSKMNSRI